MNLADVLRLYERDVDDSWLISDHGMGLVLVREFGDVIRYATDTGRWFVCSNGRWDEDSEERLKLLALAQHAVRVARDHVATWDDETGARQRALVQVNSYEGVRKKRSLLDAAATDARVQVKEHDFDVTEHEIVAIDEVIDLNTGEVRPCRPEDMNSRSCTVRFNPAAESARLDEFLETFLPDPADQRFVFALLGHSLRVGNDRRVLPIFWGPTTSGKSQLFAALHQLLGGYICTVGASVFRGNLDDKPRPDLVNAMFTRIAYATEAAKSWALHADQVKRLTGGDVLPYRNLYRGIVNERPRFTPMLVTNEFPRIVSADWPTKRRILAVHFDRSLEPGQENPEKKREFLADPAVAVALLARLVAGARDDILTDVEKIPKKYVLATMNARGDVDHTDEFLAWATDEGLLQVVDADLPASHCVKASDLHGLYAYWLRKYGDDVDRRDQLNLRNLGTTLREKGWESVQSGGTRWVGRRLVEPLPIWVRI